MLVHAASLPVPPRSLWHSDPGPLARLSLAGGGVRAARRIMTALLVIRCWRVCCLGLHCASIWGAGRRPRSSPGKRLRSPSCARRCRRHAFLACPPGYCSAAEADRRARHSTCLGSAFHEYWTEVISGEKRMVSVAADPDARRLCLHPALAHLSFPRHRHGRVCSARARSVEPCHFQPVAIRRIRFRGRIASGSRRWLALLERWRGRRASQSDPDDGALPSNAERPSITPGCRMRRRCGRPAAGTEPRCDASPAGMNTGGRQW